MRTAMLILCLFSLTACGIVKRFIPGRPSPRVILTGGHLASLAPCTIDEADIVLAAYYSRNALGRLPS